MIEEGKKKSEIKMNVLCNLDSTVFIINRYPPQTSIYRVTQHLLSVLGDNSTEVDLWFTPKDAKEINSGVGFAGKFSKLPLLNNLFPNFAFSDARKYIKWKSRDAGRVIVHYSNQFSGVLKITGVTNIVSVHDSPYYVENSSFVEKYYVNKLYNSLRKQKYIVTSTNHLKDELIDFGFEGNITTVYLPYSPIFQYVSTDKKEIRIKLGLPTDKKLILSVSTGLPRKNLPMVKKVMDKLGEDFKLVRVGTPLGNSVTFKGVNDNFLRDLYYACDALLFPSLYEGFGLPIIEAFASGLPVITSNIPTINEISGDAAILCNPRDEEDLKEGVKYALENKDYLIKKGIERSAFFSLEKFKENILSLYGRIEKNM